MAGNPCLAIAKALGNADLVVELQTNLEGLRVFYTLHVLTRRRQQNIVQPWRYFLYLNDLIFRQGHGFVLIAKYKGRPIASAVFLHAYNTMTYKHSASLPEYWHLAPNHLIIWEAMRIALKLGFRWFDWGRTGIHHNSLRKFKLRWACEENILTYHTLGPQRPLGAVFASSLRCAIGRFENRLPSFFTKVVGTALYRYYP